MFTAKLLQLWTSTAEQRLLVSPPDSPERKLAEEKTVDPLGQEQERGLKTRGSLLFTCCGTMSSH